MNDYMKALHKRFFRGPDCIELEEDVERIRLELRDCLYGGLCGEERAGDHQPCCSIGQKGAPHVKRHTGILFSAVELVVAY